MYIVELLVEDPFLGAVFTLESAIGRAVSVCLNQAEIRSDHFRLRVLPCELHCPDACTCPDIQDISRLPNGRDVQLLIKEKVPPAVLKIYR